MTHIDPFGSATVSPEEEGMQGVDIQAAERPQAVHSSEALSVTLKAHSGHEAPLVFIKGGTVAEVKETLQDVVQAELLDDIAAAVKTFSAVAGRPTASAASAAAQQSYTAPAAQAAAAAAAPAAKRFTPVQGDACEHGQLVYDEWTNPRTQKTSRAYKCPLKVANWRDPNACNAIKWAG